MAIRHPENIIFKFHSTTYLMGLLVIGHNSLSLDLVPFGIPKLLIIQVKDARLSRLSVCFQPNVQRKQNLLAPSSFQQQQKKNTLLSTTVSSQGMRMISSEAMCVLCLSMAIVVGLHSPELNCYHRVLEMSNVVRFFQHDTPSLNPPTPPTIPPFFVQSPFPHASPLPLPSLPSNCL